MNIPASAATMAIRIGNYGQLLTEKLWQNRQARFDILVLIKKHADLS